MLQQQVCPSHSPIPFSLQFCMLQEYLIFFTLELQKVFSSFLITLHLIIFHSLTFLLFNFVYSLNYLEVQHVRMSTKLMAKQTSCWLTHMQRETFPWGFASFSLLFVPDHFLEIQKSLVPVSEDQLFSLGDIWLPQTWPS